MGDVRGGEGENHTINMKATDFKGGIFKGMTVLR